MTKVGYGASLAVIAFAVSAAGAQTTGAGADAGGTAVEPAADRVEDIIVTARKREESLQTVPIAVSAFSAKALVQQHIENLANLRFVVPNLSVVANQGTPNGAQIYLRGIGQDDQTVTAEGGVGVYLDGVFLGSAIGGLLDTNEFERIEVLRGPQGTLYGRNTTAGAIKFVSRRPSLTDPRFVLDATVGSFDLLLFRGSASVPLVTDRLAVKIDVISNNRSGFVKDLARGEDINDINRRQVRVSTLWQPTDRFSLYASGDYGVDNSNINVPIAISAGPTGIFAPTYGVRTTTRGIDNRQGFKGGHLAIDAGYDLGFATVRSITGYSGYRNRLALDLDAQVAPIADVYSRTRQSQFSEELQLTSNGTGPFKYVAGLFYFYSDSKLLWRNVGGNILNDIHQKTYSKAIFGEASYAIVDTLSLTVGGRYTWDDKTLDTSAITFSTGASRFSFQNIKPSWNDFTPKVAVDWKPVADTLVYASYTRGFKAGGFAAVPTDATQALATFNPEKARTTEVGAKAELFDHRLRLNAAYFWTDYTDLQLSYRQAGTFFTTTADAKIQGFELEGEARPVTGLTLRGSVGTLDAHYTKIPINPATGTSFVAGLTLNNKLKHVPDLTYRVGGTYEVPLPSVGRLEFTADYTWTDDIFYTVSNATSALQPAYGLLDAQIALALRDGKIRLSVGARNLTNKDYFTTAVAGLSRFYGAPRELYANVRYEF